MHLILEETATAVIIRRNETTKGRALKAARAIAEAEAEPLLFYAEPKPLTVATKTTVEVKLAKPARKRKGNGAGRQVPAGEVEAGY